MDQSLRSSETSGSATDRRPAVAVAAMFFVNGATFSNWLPRIPEIRDELGLGNAGLGVTLLGGGLGGIIGALVVGRLSERIGSRRMLTIAALCLSAGMPLIASAPSAALLMVLLTLLGALDVFNDVAMNSQGVMVQERLQQPIMNRLHGMWSLGFTGGAVVGSVARVTEIDIQVHLAIVGAVLLATVLALRRWLIPTDPSHDPAAMPVGDAGTERARRGPTVAMVAMAMAAIGAIVLEVTPNDWASVLLTDEFDAGRFSGLGTVACAGAMLVGRLSGDHVQARVGDRRLLTGSMTLIAAGASITVIAPVTAIAIIGLVIWGLGLSVVFPQLYATAARLPGTSAGAGLGWMLLGQRFGSMVCAVAVGVVSQWQGMRAAFAVVCGIALVMLLVSLRTASSAAQPVARGSDAVTG